MSVRASLARPLRNRVTPFGEIVAFPQRGSLMGNRGCLHDDEGRLVRTSASRAWICCEPTWPGRNRDLMAPGRYTELFFLDEATALAAGHRPCGECRRERLQAFKQAWAEAHGLDHLPRVQEIDAVLVLERGKRSPIGSIDDLPDGVMLTDAAGQGAWLVGDGALWLWSPDGYARSGSPDPETMMAITPPSVIAIILAGYRPIFDTERP